MLSFTSKDAKNQLGKVFRAAVIEPVEITNHGTPILRIMSVEHAKNCAPERNRQDHLDVLKHRLSCEVLSRFQVGMIRDHALSNLQRWKAKGTWGEAYEEWFEIITSGDDLQLISSMIGFSQNSNRLRQSMPYVGMLDEATVRRIREEI